MAPIIDRYIERRAERDWNVSVFEPAACDGASSFAPNPTRFTPPLTRTTATD